MQERCQALLAEAGYAQYEVSAYAPPGRQCAHNLNYWRFGDYLGIGAGAHGKLTLGARAEHPAPLEAQAPDALPGRGRHARRRSAATTASTPARRPFEFMLNALRLVEGFALADFEARTGLPRSRSDEAAAGGMHAAGWLERDGDRIRPTELGRRFTNDVMSLFLDTAQAPASGTLPAA